MTTNLETTTEQKKFLRDKSSGISLALTFLICGFVTFYTSFFENEIATNLISFLLFVIGMMGLSSETAKLNKKAIGIDDVGIGLGLILIGLVIYYYLPFYLVKIFVAFIVFLGTYGVITGLILLVMSIFSKQQNWQEKLMKSIIVIIQFIGFVSAILTIISYFKAS